MTDLNIILEKATELGKLMKESKIVSDYNTAKAVFDADEEVNDLVGQFNLARMNLTNESQKQTPDSSRVEELQKQTQEIYEKIMGKPAMQALDSANLALEDMVKKVNQILQSSISGEAAAGCTHDCSTCGGCH